MSLLKEKNVKMCVTLLREFIEESVETPKKGMAQLALAQLLQITAGDAGTPEDGVGCFGRPRVDRGV